MIITESRAESSLGPLYRLKRGTKAADIHPNPPVPPLTAFDGPFGLAEYLSAKIAADPHDVAGLVVVPKDADRDMWIYEHLRRIIMDLTPLVTALLQVCNRTDCPQMRAEEWMYLCVAHEGATAECCAIDYILHSLDSTTSLLSSSAFPSRLHMPSSSTSHFPSLFRRLSRIFSHAYYHHRETFELAEAENALYARFVALCETYELVGTHMLAIPRSAVGRGKSDEDDDEEKGDAASDGRGMSSGAGAGATVRGLGRSGTALFEPSAPLSTPEAPPVSREGTVRRPLNVLRRGTERPNGKTLWTSSELDAADEDADEDAEAGASSADALASEGGAGGAQDAELERATSRESAVYLGEDQGQTDGGGVSGKADTAHGPSISAEVDAQDQSESSSGPASSREGTQSHDQSTEDGGGTGSETALSVEAEGSSEGVKG